MWCSRYAGGHGHDPGGQPDQATEQTIIASVCRGVMPTALNTPMSCARSLTCSATVFSTPRPATTVIRIVSIATSVRMACSSRPPLLIVRDS